MATYGSGSASWNSGGYNSCVQQCVAQFGAPSAAAMPAAATASATSTDAGTGGSPGSSGATHTVIVAPSQGVLRYVPFAVNASVGDTIKFEWHANVHTVTKSSALEICNKTGDAPFVSGTHNASFTCTCTPRARSPRGR
jgi:plastocyanin